MAIFIRYYRVMYRKCSSSTRWPALRQRRVEQQAMVTICVHWLHTIWRSSTSIRVIDSWRDKYSKSIAPYKIRDQFIALLQTIEYENIIWHDICCIQFDRKRDEWLRRKEERWLLCVSVIVQFPNWENGWFSCFIWFITKQATKCVLVNFIKITIQSIFVEFIFNKSI